MTRTEVLAELAIAEAELRAVAEEADRVAHAVGFLDKWQAIDFGARADDIKQRLFHLRCELKKLP